MMDWNDSVGWLVFGLLGNAAFASRFLLQWLASERAGDSVVPVAVWYLSILGSLILLVYAFAASTLPVWALLQPRDYLNSLLLYLGLAAAYTGMFVLQPSFVAPAANRARARSCCNLRHRSSVGLP